MPKSPTWDLPRGKTLLTAESKSRIQLDDFLTLYEYDKYNEAGTISAEQAKEKAYAEYDKFRFIQDKEFLSDFDKEIKIWKEKEGYGKD